MAIDTREKRANVLGVARPWIRSKEPDASKDEAWRASSANSYGGNLLSPTIALSFGTLAASPQKGSVAETPGRSVFASSERGLVSELPGRGLVAQRADRGLKVDEFE